MGKRKLVLLVIFLSIGLLLLVKLDMSTRYNMGILEYYKYNAPLTEQEKEYIREKPFIVGIYNDPPLAFTNEYNNYNSGIMVDYLSQIAIELSGNVLLRVISEEDKLDTLQNNTVEAVVIENTPANRGQVDMSIPLCVVKTKVLVHNNSDITRLEDLKDRTLVVLERDNAEDRIAHFFDSSVHLVAVDNIYQAFALLSKGQVDGFVGDDMEAAHFLNATKISGTYRFLEATLHRSEICLGVARGNDTLLKGLNKGIIELKKKNLISQTQYKWLGNFTSDSVDLRSLEGIYKVILAVGLIITAFSGWNYVITQRVNTKTKELSESKEELRLIIDTIHSGLMVMDSSGRIMECNDTISHITGVGRDQLLGANVQEIQALAPFISQDNRNVVFSMGRAYYYVTQQKMASNKSMIMVEDYTEKHFNEKRARQESKMAAVGQLSAGLAHEIRNPLGLIKSYVYVLEKNKLNEISKHAIAVIYDSVNRINNLIENLLRFSRLSNEEVRPINIHSFLDMLLQLEEKNLKEKDIEMHYQVAGVSLEEMYLNEDVLRMVLLNLINNSIDSFEGLTRQGKKIHLRIDAGEESVKIRLSDNGKGIDSSEIDKVFDPFYSTKEKGTGLGLYIISTEIYNHDGSITVDSKPGEGTVFDIVLPVKR